MAKSQRFVSLSKREFAAKWQHCLRKQNFKNQAEANRVLAKMQRRKADDIEFLTSYKCQYEDHWHIGHDLR